MTKIREVEEDGIEKTFIEVKEGVTLVSTFYDNLQSHNGIILFPGITEHRSSLDELGQQLASHFKVWAFDLNSQGESTGKWDLNEMQQSVFMIQKLLRERHDLGKIGGYGNSAGGMAVGLTAAQDSSTLDSLCLTSTPAALQEVIPKIVCQMLSYVPQSWVKWGTIKFDEKQARINENYRKKSHAQFKTEAGYQPYAQFGALKIDNLRKMMNYIVEAPRLDEQASRITQPTLLVYGGDDSLLKIKRTRLPKNIQKMCDSISDKIWIVVDGADHSLNEKTLLDGSFNQDPKYSFVKEYIVGHFGRFML